MAASSSANYCWNGSLPFGSKRRRVWRGGGGRNHYQRDSARPAAYRIVPLPPVAAPELRLAWTIGSVRLAAAVEGARAPVTQLEPQGLLDDTLLEFFCRFIERYNVPTAIRNNVFCFNSYFYTKLQAGGAHPAARHAQVSRWTNRLGSADDDAFLPWPGSAAAAKTAPAFPRHFLWEKDVIIVPVNLRSCHWAVVLICFPYLALRRGKAPPSASPASLEGLVGGTMPPAAAKEDGRDSHSSSTVAACPQLPSNGAESAIVPETVPAAVDLSVSDDDSGGVEVEEGLLLSTEEGMRPASPTAAAASPNHLAARSAASCPSSSSQPPFAAAAAAFASPYPEGPHLASASAVAAGSASQQQPPRTAVSLQLFDELADFASGCPREEGKPVILHLDSLSSTSSGPPVDLRQNIVSYLAHEFHSRQKEADFHLSTTDEDWLYIPDVQLPTQANAYDCGVFLLEFLRFLFVNPPRLVNLLRQETARHFSTTQHPPAVSTFGAEEGELEAEEGGNVLAADALSTRPPLESTAAVTTDTDWRHSEEERSALVYIEDNGEKCRRNAMKGKLMPKLSASAFWFTQNTVELRRLCLRQMLLYMAAHPYWQTDHVMTSNKAEFLLQSDHLGHLRDLLNCTERSPIAGAVLRANALGRFAVVLPSPERHQSLQPIPPPPQPSSVQNPSPTTLIMPSLANPLHDIDDARLPQIVTTAAAEESQQSSRRDGKRTTAEPPPYARPRSLDRGVCSSRRPWHAARSLDRRDFPASKLLPSSSSPLPPPQRAGTGAPHGSTPTSRSPPARRVKTPPPARTNKPTTVSAILAGRSLAMDAPPRSLFLCESGTRRCHSSEQQQALHRHRTTRYNETKQN